MLYELSHIFLTFLNKNMTVSVVIIAVLLARLLLHNMPKKYSYVLWSIVGIRMIFDLTIASRLSVFNLFRGFAGRTSAVSTMLTAPAPLKNAADTYVNPALNTSGGANMTDAASHVASANSAAHDALHTLTASQTVLGILGLVWLIGIGLFVAYGIYSYVKCRILVRTAVLANDIATTHRVSVWECDRIPSPFVLGIIRPRIYIPFRMPDQEQAYILAHEQYHIRRLDPLWKLIAFVLLAVYWWNPLAWIAFFYMVRDMEMSCDEAVIEQFGNEIKQGYSSSLLSFAMERHPYSFAPVAFGEGDAGRRIKNVLRFKKPQTWVAIIVIALLVVVGVSCLTNRKDDNIANASQNTQEQNSEISSEVISDTQDNQLTGTEIEPTETPDAIYASVDKTPWRGLNKWATAFCDRNVKTIKKMSTDAAKESLKQKNILDDNGNFGWSSPWPSWDSDSGISGYTISDVNVPENTATILYYAWTSDPHVTVWAETVQYAWNNDTFEITGEDLQMLDVISSGAEFNLAYPDGIISTPMNYYASGMLETLNDHAMSAGGMSPDGKHDLTDPIDAARYFLNLLPNDSKVEIDTSSDNSTFTVLQVHFTEDDVTRHIVMSHPNTGDGIWRVDQVF